MDHPVLYPLEIDHKFSLLITESKFQAWTHHAVNQDCVFYDSCPSLNPATCTDCVSGNRTCSQGEGCYFNGICQVYRVAYSK